MLPAVIVMENRQSDHRLVILPLLRESARYNTPMPSERDKASENPSKDAVRRFTVFELCVWIAAFCVSLSVLRATVSADASLSFVVAILLDCAGVAAICLLGACSGVPVFLLVNGRQGTATGAILGAVWILVFLYMLWG